MERSAHLDTFARDNLPPLEWWPEMLLEGNPDVDYPARLNCAVALLGEQVAAGHGDRVALQWAEG
ncbi:MAG: 2-aminobenzoate-CoA ligase, partial [Alcaligenes sp.]